MKKKICSPSTPCKILDDCLGMENERKAGLAQFVLTNMRTGKRGKPIAIVFKKSASDQGICLNWCPFCASEFPSLKVKS